MRKGLVWIVCRSDFGRDYHWFVSQRMAAGKEKK